MGRLRLIPTRPTTPAGTNPAFRAGASTALWHHNGFGAGAHYALEVDATDARRMVVEPGISTRVWYFAADAETGFTQAEIAAAAGVSVSSVTAAWLAGAGNAGQYGLRSDRPLTWAVNGLAEIGRTLYTSRWSRQSAAVNSEWALFQRGGTYFVAGVESRATFGIREGESPLHPILHGAFGAGARPVFTQEVTRPNATARPHNWVWQSLDFRGQHDLEAFFNSMMYADCNFTCPKGGLYSSAGPVGEFVGLTVYGTSFIDNVRAVPINGTSWAQANPNAADGHFTSKQNGFLRWRCLYDRNGWSPTYNIDGVTWNNGEFGQPPSTYSHHNYDSGASRDVTSIECVYARAPFDAINGRPGLFANLLVNLEAPHGDLFGLGYLELTNLTDRTGLFSSGGEAYLVGLSSGKAYQFLRFTGQNPTVSPVIEMAYRGEDVFSPGERFRDTLSLAEATFVNYDANVGTIVGNLNYANRLLVMGQARLRTSNEPGARGGVISGASNNGNGGTYKNIIGANSIDPQHFAAETTNPDERFRKATSLDARMDPSRFSNAYRYDNVTVFNWGGNNINVSGVSQANRNRVTIGAWADEEQGVALGTNNANGAIDYIRTRSDRCLLAVEIWNHAQGLLGRPTMGHTPGAVARFDPDPDGDGFRTDTPDSWLIDGVRGDFPVDGDDCELQGNLAYCYRTWRFADMDFGLGGGWRMHGGHVSCETTKGNGSVELRGAGQFWLGTSSADITVNAPAGRLGIAGTVSQVRGAFSGRAELLIVPGGTLTISTGDTISLTGGNVLMGADGQAGAASLTVQGTLNFVAAGGAMPRVREFRSGRYGLIDVASGVTGQPKPPNVTFNVTLASGSMITVDTTGLAPGSVHDLIVCDSLTNAGATLPANAAIIGGNTLRLTMP